MTTQILNGDCIEMMKTLPDKSVNCCVTSPPYFGLRDYGHEGQIGLEETPDAYVAKLVAVFREVKRLLRDDGTLWLNLGDSYAAQRGGTEMPAETIAGGKGGKSQDLEAYRGRGFSPKTITGQESAESRTNPVAHRNCRSFGLKHKDLIGIPWRVAFALQADGWYLRQDIIWHKPNPMPESVGDRCTKAHEYIFLLSKSQSYFYDRMAIAEPAIYAEQHANKATSWGKKKADAGVKANIEQYQQIGVENNKTCLEGGMKNKRSVWSVNVKPYKEAHFATYPPELIKPCILAGCPKGGVVLDPFGGSGTTGQVAMEEGRKAILCELNHEYVQIMNQRLNRVTPSLWSQPMEALK
jgi:site-specific DNA-methyltransferase (adenine-specific)